ncbi:HlyD family secretion protein [Roseovarius nanhaiticus]|uniref:HlyD family secretion protein n=2 Tax=Roseovarius nanhaiticus TaxID=573024 RepID=A0A1N7FQJ7_9RHOB|nr:HlyD family secretion protein [Roseovarius nanhaiticus]SIS02642.1 HlyD family secretion protein [Roseovarius nanhaiticus]
MMNKRVGALAALLLVIAVIGIGWWQLSQRSDLPEGISASNGRIEAERIAVATKLAGRVSEVVVDEGDWVEAGQAIARMDTADLDAQLRQAQAAVLQARQQKLQAEAILRQHRSELKTAEAEFARVEQLAAKGFDTQAQLDTQRTALESAQAAVASAEAGIPLADATIAAAEAAVDGVQSLIDDSRLTAPRAGRVQYVLEHPGEVVAAGSSIVTLTDLSDMYMTIYLPSRDAGRVAIGSEARIILDAVPDYVIPATVTFVASTAQFTPKSVETADERAQLMFRVKLTIAPDLLAAYQDRARAGVPGVGYVKVSDAAEWPETLEVRLPQ